MNWRPQTAMILGAGLGKRMRPLTGHIPKPMVPFMGRPLIDSILDRLMAAGIEEVVVNTHYLADVLEAHLKNYHGLRIKFSDERDELLDTGGGVTKALPLLGDDAFLIHNSDSLSIEPEGSNLDNLARHWRPQDMDTLLLLAPIAESLGYGGTGDFRLTEHDRVERPPPGSDAPYVFTGLSLAHPRLFKDAPKGPFSLNRLWTRAIEDGRAYGVIHKGLWMHIGTPDALKEAEKAAAQ